MANEFSIKRNDTKPFIKANLQDATGSAVDLTNATGIFFNLATNDNTYTAVLSGASLTSGTTNGSTAGVVEYQWNAGDTNRSGNYLGEFEVTYTDGTISTFPADHSLRIKIYEDYDS